MLELAAKAAGIEVVRSRFDDPLNVDFLVVNSARNVTERFGPWNPLTDDGDALRLAVKLKLEIWQGREEALCGDNRNPTIREPYGADPYAATRRAIVRAAASLPADTQG